MAPDGAGWRTAGGLRIPPAVALAPPCSRPLTPMERVRLRLRERILSPRVLAGCDALVDACRTA
jgi:hypothetical protein